MAVAYPVITMSSRTGHRFGRAGGAALCLALGSAACRAGLPADAVRAQADARWMLEYYVAALQENYRAAHGHFAADYSALFDPGTRITSVALGRARTGLSVRIAAADSDGWSAAASVAAVPGLVCILNVGTPPTYLAVPDRGARVGRSGEVLCAGFGP
jgi:hypothetical protein